jgi:hypothetical protein
VHAEALALKLELRQPVLCKEREEIAQLVHRKLRFGTALGLIRRMPASPTLAAVTAAAAATAAATFRLLRLLLLLFIARLSCCCAFLVIHLLFDSERQDVFERSTSLFATKRKASTVPWGYAPTVN